MLNPNTDVRNGLRSGDPCFPVLVLQKAANLVVGVYDVYEVVVR